MKALLFKIFGWGNCPETFSFVCLCSFSVDNLLRITIYFLWPFAYGENMVNVLIFHRQRQFVHPKNASIEFRHRPLYVYITCILNIPLGSKGFWSRKRFGDRLHSNSQVNGRTKVKESARNRRGVWLGLENILLTVNESHMYRKYGSLVRLEANGPRLGLRKRCLIK